jgi:hypothetical protein
MKDHARFITWWALAVTFIALGTAALNVLIDPYMLLNMPRIAGFNARKPAIGTQGRLMKAYDVQRLAPRTLLLGSSRVDFGLDAADPHWPHIEQPVYNLGLAGGIPYVAYRYLQHSMSHAGIDLVVMGLDFEYFLTIPEAQHNAVPGYESRLAVDQQGLPNRQRDGQYYRDVLNSTLSLDATFDSGLTLLANLDMTGMDIQSGNTLTNDLFTNQTAPRGAYPLFSIIDAFITLRYSGMRNEFAMADIRSILELCRQHRVRIVLLINPLHADVLEIMDLRGHWDSFEAWKRELVQLVEEYSAGPQSESAQLWDFTEYDRYSTEPIGAQSALPRWFWEPNHYTHALGSAVIQRILGGRGYADFGERIDSNNIEGHLTQIRAQRNRYRDSHAPQIQRVRTFAAIATGSATLPHPAVDLSAQPKEAHRAP